MLYGGVFGLGIYVDIERDIGIYPAIVHGLEIAPRALAPLAMQQVNEPNDYTPLGAKMVADTIEIIAGALIVNIATS